MPGWVQQGYDEYAKRLPRECELVLKEITPGKRSKNSDVVRIVKDEGERMLAAIPHGAQLNCLLNLYLCEYKVEIILDHLLSFQLLQY